MAKQLKPNKPFGFFTSPFFPAFLSGLVAPGMGQLFNRDYSKGFFLLVTSFTSFFWFSRVLTNQLSLLLPGTPDSWQQNPETLKEAIIKLVDQSPGMFLTFQLLVVTIWIFGMVDAFLVAKKQKNKPSPREHSDSPTDPTT